ncbi:MAG: heavy metal translocating P-type ATPase [Kiritimatiellia bacterium]
MFAGTENLTGALDVTVTRVGADTTLGQVRKLILAAEQTRLPVMRMMDGYAAYYTPFVLALGLLVWFFTGDWSRVVSILVVSCPCAVVLAAPTAMVAALSAAARSGILVKHIADLEAFARVSAVVLDKTGTLTTGRLGVSKVLPAEGVAMADLVRAAATAERHSNHPAARALRELAQGAGIPLGETAEFSEAPGRGVIARIDGVEVRVGRGVWLAETGLAAVPPKDIEDGSSVVGVSIGGKLAGWIALQDQVRPGAAAALRELEALGIRHIAMVTGDRGSVADSVSRRIGCPHVKADCLPGEKVAYVNEVKARGHRVAVVGDGVNDAPALAAGDTGIAMGAAGSDVAINSATMALMSNDLARIPFLVRLSRQSRAVILQNLAVGLVFITAGWVLGGAGDLTPVGGAILHNVGSFIVLFNSARIVRAGDDLEPQGKTGGGA